MAEITATMVKELRQMTGAGPLDCKKALTETNGDYEAAADLLKKKGMAKVDKKLDRDTNEGLIGTYIHPGSKVVGVVEVNCESDFVARTEQFQQLSRDLAMHVVASNPKHVSREDVPDAEIEKEKELFREQEAESGKPAEIVDKIITGKIDKWLGEQCLLEQPFVKNPDLTIEQLLKETIVSLGENIQVSRFERLEVGG